MSLFNAELPPNEPAWIISRACPTGCVEKIKQLEAKVRRMEEALNASIPCLEDWIRSTGYGEINRRDKSALNLIRQALKEEKP